MGLLGYSDRIELYLRPKLGTSQVFYMAYKIFEKLNLEREHPTRRPAHLKVAVDFMLARLKSRHSIILLTDLVDLVNDPDAVDFKQLSTLAAKHDMIVLVLDDPEEFRVRSRLGYIRISDMETRKQTVISARKAGRDSAAHRGDAGVAAVQAEAPGGHRLDGADGAEPPRGAAQVPDVAIRALGVCAVERRGPSQTGREDRVTMTRLLVVAVGFLSIAPPSAAQPPDLGVPGAGLVRVETLELEPTVVKTGDRITQRYRLRFPDLIPSGQEIIILEDRMTPEALPVHPFEATALVVEKDRIEDTHIWDFVYEFRLVDPNKMTYALPSFSFYYLVRDLGEDIEDAEVQQVDGGQGLVRYVTSITDEPLLDIRDTVELGTFSGLATVFRALAWVVAPPAAARLARDAGAVRPQAEGGLYREAAGRGRAGPHRGSDPRPPVDLGGRAGR